MPCSTLGAPRLSTRSNLMLNGSHEFVSPLPIKFAGIQKEGVKGMSYQPRPIDLAHVALTEEILKLIERLAENAHDVWAAKRMMEGWTLGPKKDSDLKQTPLLVPYAELPESEKQYDRDLALTTLKAILALGYRIEKSE